MGFVRVAFAPFGVGRAAGTIFRFAKALEAVDPEAHAAVLGRPETLRDQARLPRPVDEDEDMPTLHLEAGVGGRAAPSGTVSPVARSAPDGALELSAGSVAEARVR